MAFFFYTQRTCVGSSVMLEDCKKKKKNRKVVSKQFLIAGRIRDVNIGPGPCNYANARRYDDEASSLGVYRFDVEKTAFLTDENQQLVAAINYRFPHRRTPPSDCCCHRGNFNDSSEKRFLLLLSGAHLPGGSGSGWKF